MRIAINAIDLQNSLPETRGIVQILLSLTQSLPAHQFLFLFHQEPGIDWEFQKNSQYQLMAAPSNQVMAKQYWLDIKLPWALRSFKPDLLLQFGTGISLRSSVKQIWILPNLSYWQLPAHFGALEKLFYQQFYLKYLSKASHLICFSDWHKQSLLQKFGPIPTPVSVLRLKANSKLAPLLFHEKESVKAGFADGREYFFNPAPATATYNIIGLLKAFSLFKKWQKSNMKLLITEASADVYQQLKTYKYRDDIVLLPSLSGVHYQSILAAAYALVYPAWSVNSGQAIIDAQAAGVPVIAANTGALPELGAAAALFASPENHESLAELMLSLYKNENQKQALVNEGLKRSEQVIPGLLLDQFSKILAEA